MPALLTSTSMRPLASSAAAMLSGFVTSSATTRSRSDRGRTSARGFRMVAITFQPCAWKWRAVSRPYPEEHPVMSTVFMRETLAIAGRTLYHVESTFHL